MQEFYVGKNGQQNGPYSLEELDQMLQSESISGDDLYWHKGADDWQPISRLPGYVAPPVSSAPPPLPRPQGASPSLSASSSVSERKPWFKQTWVHVLLFIFVPFVQVPLMWGLKVFSLRTRIILSVVGLFLSLGYFLPNPPSTQASSHSPAPAAPNRTPERPLQQQAISWSEVNSIYNLQSRKTDLQKDEEWKRLKGKKVNWSGDVVSISDGFGGLTLQIKMNPDTFVSDLLIQLKRSERSKALSLSKGDFITFSGTLKNWGSLLPITLDDGVLQ